MKCALVLEHVRAFVSKCMYVRIRTRAISLECLSVDDDSYSNKQSVNAMSYVSLHPSLLFSHTVVDGWVGAASVAAACGVTADKI